MHSLTFNKIAGAVLSCLLLLVGVHTFVEILYPGEPENVPHGTVVKASATGGQNEANSSAPTPADKPWSAVVASVNVEAGQASVKKCASCHSWDKGGATKVGPNLYGVVGRDIGKLPGFAYSQAFQAKGGKWTPDALYDYLKNPKQYIPGNKMAFAGLDNAQERANVIAFLNKQSDAAAPLDAK